MAFLNAQPNKFPTFTGAGHTDCHSNTPAYESVGGYFDIILSSGNTVETNEVFTITLTVRNFLESSSEDLSLGFPDGTPGRGDNALWQTDGGTFNTTQYDAVSLSGTGDSPSYDFTLNAPTSTGSYTLVADAIHDEPDGDGAEEIVFVTVNITLTVVIGDNSAPSVVITAPSTNTYVRGSIVSITATANDGAGAGVDQVWAEISNATYSENVTLSGTEPNYSGTWDSTVVFDGTYTLTLYANDTAGNLNNTESISIQVDNTAPSITLDSVIPNPSNGITVITASNSTEVLDGNGIMANVSLPGGGYYFPTMTFQGGNTWNGTFDVNSYSDGTFNVRVNGTDLAGNTGFAGPTAVTGDTANPSITINSPNMNDAFNSTAPSFSVTISDTNLDTQWYTIDSGTTNTTFAGSSGTINQTLWDVKGNETMILAFYANDTAGNEYSASVVIIKDILVPSISITIPSTNDLIGVSAPTYSLSITEGNLDSIWYSLNGGTISNSSVVSASGTIDQALWDAELDGNVTITFWANDTLGNLGINTVKIQKDTSGPVVVLNSPNTNDIFSFLSPSYDLSISGVNTTWYTLNNGITNTTFSGTTGNINQTLWNGLVNGTYILRFYANDSVGNVNYDEVSVIKDVLSPVVGITTPNTNDLIGVSAPSYSLSITEGNIDSIWYSLNGGVTSNSSVVSVSGTIDQALWDAASNGSVTITFWANDTAGNVGTNTVDVVLDELAPIISITIPNTNDLIGVSAPTYSLSIIEGNLDSIWYSLNDGVSSNSSIVGASGTIDQALWDAASNGSVTITFWANDTLGNVGINTVDVLLDELVPIISITTPNTNDLIGVTAPTYSLSITEGNLDSIWYSLNNGLTSNSSVVSASGTINQALWDLAFNGTVTITFWANDTLGNLGINTVDVELDNTAPIITINQPIESQIFNETSPVFDISINETNLDSIWYTFDSGATNFTVIALIDSIDQGLWDVTPNGNITITFYANDTLGNLGFNKVVVNKSVIDILGPILSALGEVSDPSELGKNVTIQIDAFDISNISSVQIDIKGTRYDMSFIGGDRYEYQWTPGSAEIISYTIYANDTIGNINSIIDSILIQDTILPEYSNLIESLVLVDPADDIIISLDATDISGIKKIIISFEGTYDNMTNTVGDTWSYTITAPNIDGTYYYMIYITDNSNNVNSVEGSIRVGSPVSGEADGTTDGVTIPLFLGIIGVLGVVNIILLLKKFRGGKS